MKNRDSGGRRKAPAAPSSNAKNTAGGFAVDALRIAQIVGGFQPNRGGVARFVGTVAEELSKIGHKLDIFSLGPTSPSKGSRVLEFPPEALLSARLWKGIRDGRYDVIHVHGYSSWVPLKALPAEILSPATRVLTPHFHAVGSYPVVARRAFDAIVGRTTTRVAHQIQVDTEAELQALLLVHPIERRRFAVVPPPLARCFSDIPPRQNRKASDGKFRVLFVGRLDPQKRLDLLVGAVRTLESRDPGKFELVVVGDDYLSYISRLKEPLAGLPAGAFSFRGAIDDDQLRHLYDTSDALVLPSRYEAFGIVLLEAMSRGLPVIGSRTGGIPYLIRSGKNGLLVPYGDSEALVATVWNLAQDRELWSRLSRAGIETAAMYSPERIAEIMVAAYRFAIDARETD